MQPTRAATTKQPSSAPAASNDNSAEAFDTSWFLRDNRIHIEDGSHFLRQNFLMIHPKELTAENQQRTFAKIIKHMALPAPSFFESYPRNAAVFSLASYLPISKESRLASLKEQTAKLEEYAKTGAHPDSDELLTRYLKPFTANAKMRLEEPEIDPADREFMASAVTLYLVINEALSIQGRPKEPAAYLNSPRSADGILADLTGKLGMSMAEFVEIAQTKGINGIAERLSVPAESVNEIRQLTAIAADQHYADNVIQSWDVGRKVQGMENRSIPEKIAVGVLQRSAGLLQTLQHTIPVDAPVPLDVQHQEKIIMANLRELPKPLQEALYYSGAELGFIAAHNLAPVRPQLNRAVGVNWMIPFEVGGDYGMRQIINSNLDHRGYSRRVLHHEANHLFFPKQLGDQGIEQLETFIKEDVQRLTALRNALDLWKTAETPEAKQKLEAAIDQQFRVGEIGLSKALAKGSGNEIGMDRLHNLVDHALKNLDPDSKTLSNGYPIPELRAAEVISRFAELLFVDLADSPAMLGFMTPGLMVGYHDIYLPHVEKQVEAFKKEQQHLPPALRYLGLPPNAALPQKQNDAMALMSMEAAPEISSHATAMQPNTLVASDSIAAQMPAGVAKYLDKIEHTHFTDTVAQTDAFIR